MTDTNKQKKAFSLAEVLLTLVIVGTISALTIPTLKNHSDETKYVVAVQKAMAQISEATANVELEHGDASLFDFSSTDVDKWYKDAMNTIPFPNGVNAWQRVEMSGNDPFDSKFDFMTADGMAWNISNGGYKCGGGVALVDVNGAKDPNIVGIDQHGFRLGSRCGGDGGKSKIGDFGIYAMGDKLNDYNGTWACTAYVIKNKKMPWLRKVSTGCTEYMGK